MTLRFKLLFILLCLLTNSLLAQQSLLFKGLVVDESDSPLESASIVIKHIPSSGIAPIFQKSDQQGHFQFEFLKVGKIELTISRLGYQKIVDTLDSQSAERKIKYKLLKSVKRLDEVKVDYRYRAVEIAKDTIRFSADYFRDSTDRKLQDLIEKMPGFSIEEGKVRFQGKQVNVTLVENERFFGGGSKLAIENIPANAVDKVEMISRFSQNDLLKNVQVNDQLAMNVKLKENKKNFIFGDLESSLGNEKSYKEHAALFYYSPEKTMSFIGDINNIGTSPVSKEDIDRVQGAELQYFSNSVSRDALTGYNLDNRNVIKNINKFAAFNGFQKGLKKKLSANLYGVYAENRLNAMVDGANHYSFPDLRYTEKTSMRSSQVNRQASFNISSNFKPDPYFSVDYNLGTFWTMPQQQVHTNNVIDRFGVDNNNIQHQNGHSFVLKQYLEGSWKHSLRSYSSFAFQHQYTSEKDNFSLSSDSIFLRGFVRIDSMSNYSILRPVQQKKHLLNGSYKYYWVINQNQQLHLEVNSQNELLRQKGQSAGVQDTSNLDLFNHDQYYRNSSNYLGGSYRLDFDKLKILFSLKQYYLYLINQTPANDDRHGQWLLQPEVDLKYGKSTLDGFRLNYRRDYTVATAMDLNPSYWITGYNSLSRGNISMEGQRFHKLNFTYNNFRLSDFRVIHFNSTLTLKDKIKGNSLLTSSYEQLKMVQLFDRPDLNFTNLGGFSIRYGRFEPGAYLSYIHMRLAQRIDNSEIYLRQNTVSTDLSLRWFIPKCVDVKVVWTKTDSWQKSLSDNQKVILNKWNITGKYQMKNIVFKTDWSLLKTGLGDNGSDPTTINGNFELRYQKGKSPISFYIQGLNVLKNTSYRAAVLTEYISSEKIIYTMPRIFLIGLAYSL
ncbi:carboxypeptidase-like regulatory domain-containing protein [Sphingobacterium sp. NGMCC 1.201703]|uniref:carboxypeptidase-like regulatory domain-containing protein n=1 Tax=Sphingobacterium sp. NGMCC 1.201703 TaxID=3388657 RepID=UPI0039FDCBB6